MSSKIVCKSKERQLILDCQKIQKNIFRILKLLNEVGLLSVLPKTNAISQQDNIHKKQSQYITKKQKVEYVSHQHSLNTSEAIQLIWRSAYLCNSRGLPIQLARQLASNRLVGQKNELQEVMANLDKRVNTFAKKKGEQQPSIENVRKKMRRLQEVKAKINLNWTSIKEKQIMKRFLSSPQNPLSLFGEKIPLHQKELLASYTRKRLLGLDLKILQGSIMFIQELQTGHCLVSLEQCYPSFRVYKQLFKSIIGQGNYYRALKSLMLAKQQCFSKGVGFRVERFVMCHHCGKIQMQIQGKQQYVIAAQGQGYVCKGVVQPPSVYSSSYAFQEIFLLSNYDRLPLQKIEGNELIKNYQLCKEYKKYIHPYIKIYSEHCNRYYCNNCYRRLQSLKDLNKQQNSTQINISQPAKQIEHKQITKQYNRKYNQQCVFCQCKCCCARCNTLQTFNKFFAFYHALGGAFEEVSTELMFLNFHSNRVHMQLVTFQEDLQNLSNQPVSLTSADLDKLTYPQQVVKLQRLFIHSDPNHICSIECTRNLETDNESSQRDDDESSESRKIYPQVQKMFELLVQDQALDEGFQVQCGDSVGYSSKQGSNDGDEDSK